MRIRRDPNGQPMTIGFNGSEHFYLYNAQGDVVAIANYSGEVVVEYTYDAWGNPLSCTGSLASTLGKKNPFRYRGYVYDEETGLYYLKSRYYDPRVGRFICSDGILPSNRMTSSNLFAYCSNNPTALVDPSGKFGIIGGLIAGLIAIGTAGLLSACSASTSEAVQVSRNYYPQVIGSNCYGAITKKPHTYKNPGDMGGKPVPRDYMKNPSSAADHQRTVKAFDEALQADAAEGTLFREVKKLTSLNDPRIPGYTRIAIFYGTTASEGPNYHVYWEALPGEWWFVDGLDTGLFLTDVAGNKIIDPRLATVGDDIPSNFVGFYDIR